MITNEEFDLWKQHADESLQDELAALEDDPRTREDAFYRNLAFGTGGLRGLIGAGPNRMNVHTVAKATQGLANYLNDAFENPSVAIARDSRNKGEDFVQVAAEVLAANGIRVHRYPRVEPTPALSWAVRYLGCSAGICITASHNPAPYNGYKVYGADGCQITTEVAEVIQRQIDGVDTFDGVREMDLGEAEVGGLVTWIGDAILDAYLDAIVAESMAEQGDGASEISLVYTPLNGTGLECVTGILERIGVRDVRLVEEQARPDGDFPTCPYPNPEVPEALEKALALCESTEADLLIATDPDADRAGVAVRHGGGYRLLTGNEVGILLLDYLCRRFDERGEGLGDKVVVTTIVSSAMADALACDRGFQLRRTLTGFKYIGEQIGLLESAGQAGRFMMGFEESCGYLRGSYVRDKDAVLASMLVCEMARYHAAAGRDLANAFEGLCARYGYFLNGQVSVSYPGSEGARNMRAITEALRCDAPATVAGLEVREVIDYAQGAPMPVVNPSDDELQRLPSADVVEFRLEGGNRLIVRPSGTEPKIKAYTFAHADAREAAEELSASLETAAREMLTQR